MNSTEQITALPHLALVINRRLDDIDDLIREATLGSYGEDVIARLNAAKTQMGFALKRIIEDV